MSACTSRAGRRALGLVTVASLLTAGSVGLTTAATAAPVDPTAQATVKAAKGDKLRGAERAKLAKAVADGTPTVTVMVVASRGEVARAKNEVRRLGGTIRYAADELGYFSAVVPTGKVEQTVALPSIEALDLDEVVPLPEVRPDQPGPKQPPVTGGPGADDGGRQPLHADARDGLHRLQAPAPDLGRPRHHHRHPRQRRRPGAPGAAEDVHRRAQDRRHVHRDRPGHRGLARRRR